MDRHFKFVGWCSSMKDFTAVVKLSLFWVKKKGGGGRYKSPIYEWCAERSILKHET